MSHAIGAITAEGERRGILTPIYATRKPKPAPDESAHPYGCARCYGFGHVWDGTVQVPCLVCRDAKPAPAEGAAEGRFGCWQGVLMWLTPEDDDPRDTGTRAEAAAVVARVPGAKLMRVLEDGAHEAACAAAYERGKTDALRNVHALGTVEAARREERDRVCADTKKAIEKYVWDHSSVDVTHIYKLLDEAAKGQAK